MVFQTQASSPQLNDREAVSRHHQSIGRVTDVLFSEVDGRPEWLTVKTGLFNGERLAPVDGAYVDEDDTLVLPFDPPVVKNAPKPPGDHVLTPLVRDEVEAYYHHNG